MRQEMRQEARAEAKGKTRDKTKLTCGGDEDKRHDSRKNIQKPRDR